MDTYQARRQMRDLAQQAFDLMEDQAIPAGAALAELSEMEARARSLLSDAGYPGEPAWRAIQRSKRLVDLGLQDPEQRAEFVDDLRQAVERLDSLLGASTMKDTDFRIVG